MGEIAKLVARLESADRSRLEVLSARLIRWRHEGHLRDAVEGQGGISKQEALLSSVEAWSQR
jgi:hypothetical protein